MTRVHQGLSFLVLKKKNLTKTFTSEKWFLVVISNGVSYFQVKKMVESKI